ncbi:unnamed protein product [Pieris macdunnoughi]|uniref:Uncharacterized protein n=1 Tax=Pieris macdunnoughi TaxID=345717 RepID=A0A821X7U6_9NEOP|nr:unnamed protein product [Pieris macdunnoughi]
MEESPTRSYTPLSKAPHLLKKSETTTRSCNRVLPRSPEKLFECYPPKIKTSSAAQQQSSNSTRNILLAGKQKQVLLLQTK